MSNQITIDELKSYLWNSAVFLRTSIDAGAYKQYIFPLLFFKRICDVYDEETQKALEEYGEDQVKIYRSSFTPMYFALGEYRQKCDMKLICVGKEEKIVVKTHSEVWDRDDGDGTDFVLVLTIV